MSTLSVIKVNFCNYIKKKKSQYIQQLIKTLKEEKKKKAKQTKNTIMKTKITTVVPGQNSQNNPETLYLCLSNIVFPVSIKWYLLKMM